MDLSDLTLEELDQQLNLFKTLEEAADALDDFSSRVANYTAATIEGKLSDDTSVDWALGKLKDALTSIEAVGKPYAKLTEGAGLAGDLAGHFGTISSLVNAIGKAEKLSGTEQADALKSIVDGMPGLAAALTGLGGFNPVIGMFLTLYGKAIESAGVVIGQVEQRHTEQMEIIRTRGEIDVDGIRAQQGAARQAAEATRHKLQEEYDRIFEAWLNKKLAKDAARRRITERYCVQKNRAAVKRGLSEASRFPLRDRGRNIALSDVPNPDEGDLAGLNSWLRGVDGEIAESMVAGDAERARELSDAKYKVLEALQPVKDCIRQRLEWMETHGEGSGRRRLVMAGGGLLAGALLIGAIALFPNSGDSATVGATAGTTAATVSTTLSGATTSEVVTPSPTRQKADPLVSVRTTTDGEQFLLGQFVGTITDADCPGDEQHAHVAANLEGARSFQNPDVVRPDIESGCGWGT